MIGRGRSVWIVGLLVTAFALAGCAGEEKGQVDFFVKDAPVDDFSAVMVTITQVTVHKAGTADDSKEKSGGSEGSSPELSDSDVTTNESAKPDSSWIVLSSETKTVDLLKFSGNAREFLGSANITTGKYTQIRMAVSKMEGTLKNGTTVTIKVPSSTLKIVNTWSVDKDGVTKLTVDFDLNKSISQQGNGGYHFKPTLKLIKEKAKK